MLEYVIVGLLVVILLGLVLLGISLRKRKETAEIDATKLSEDISARIREDISKSVRETVSEVSERVGGVSSTLKSVVELFEKIRSELPKDVKEPVNEVLERALRDLKEFDKNIAEMGNELPNKVLKSIQSGISVRKGKVGELTTLILKREEVEITTPEEMRELTGGFAKGDDGESWGGEREESNGVSYEETEELKTEKSNLSVAR